MFDWFIVTPWLRNHYAENAELLVGGFKWTLTKIQFVDRESGQTSVYPIKYNYRVNEADLILSSVRASMGYAQIAQFMLAEDMEKQGLVQLLPDYTLASFGDIHAIYMHRKQSILATSFIEIVREVIGTPPVWERNFL
ncbi:LysR substrate-binding domain-containing protein [Vibrio sp. M260118]|uniref:LysR substrate-binding domain-containing protein n=1 Tax=Vibrio sp. M260118 TaxID=3020896 RepID=UPI002F414FFA